MPSVAATAEATTPATVGRRQALVQNTSGTGGMPRIGAELDRGAEGVVYENIDPLKVKPAEYEAKPTLADGMDVVIFDDYTPAAPPPPPTSLVYFHPSGPNSPMNGTRRL